jgi:hypothetical protein
LESSKPTWRDRLEVVGEAIVLWLWIVAVLLAELDWFVCLVRLARGEL